MNKNLIEATSYELAIRRQWVNILAKALGAHPADIQIEEISVVNF